MEINILHNSWQSRFRQPFGAVPVGEGTRLALQVHAGPSPQVLLRLWHDDTETRLPLARETEAMFTVTLPPFAVPGLYWYDFIIETGGETLRYGAKPGQTGGEGILTAAAVSSFQITVYEPWTLPDWYQKGIVYQIFPDRFRAAGKNFYPALPPRRGPKRLLHLDWDDEPRYLKDAEGRVTHWDFFGGNLAGIRAKLDHLQSLGVTAIYLNPIFEAASNHKYDTGDYLRIDPGFGDEEEFRRLAAEAGRRGIHLILDGVFSHTGADSRYFNRYGNYPGTGAYQSAASPYFSWYRFRQHPDDYECWWNVRDLPNVDEENTGYRAFILRRVLPRWQALGAKGWRLDVADELPMDFIAALRRRLKELDPEAVLIGEVWEDASHKVSYGETRCYFTGQTLDAAMDYPLRQCWLDFLLRRAGAEEVGARILSLWENYPPCAVAGALDLIGSHDTERALTVLAADGTDLARRRFFLLVLLQMTSPGVPAIYYGDEAGLTGGTDPDNRKPYPWGREDGEILYWYRRLTKLRREYDCFRQGETALLPPFGNLLGYRRHWQEEEAHILVNASPEKAAHYPPLPGRKLDLLTGQVLDGEQGFTVPPLSALVLYSLGPEKTEARKAGLLLAVSSLPGEDGCGHFGPAAYEFIDFLAAAGQSLWQILPLNPLGKGFSPYDSPGGFGLDPVYLSPEIWREEGLLTAAEIAAARRKTAGKTGYGRAYAIKARLGPLACRRFVPDKDYKDFLAANDFWLEDYCLFTALGRHFDGAPWQEWPRDIAAREAAALARYRRLLAEDISYQRFLQYSAGRQWSKVRAYAREKGIAIIGDLPLYVALNSADTWANRQLFRLDETGRPTVVAGVPPDGFSDRGQRWGNPLYCWKEMEKDDYLWWQRRIRRALAACDFLRIDHFRGLEAFWTVPAAADVCDGHWEKGPGLRFFRTLTQKLGPLPLLAEDLGHLTPEVENLKQAAGLPGMQVYQFSAAEMTGKTNNIYYSGTHDNETLLGWYRRQHPETEAETARRQCRAILERLCHSEAPWVILPLQDVLLLDNSARMNTPGTTANNWRWRLPADALTAKTAADLRALAAAAQRG